MDRWIHRKMCMYIHLSIGARKCIGDQFAFIEAVAVLTATLQRYDLELAVPPEEVGMSTGATIHTEKGLPVRISKRAGVGE